MKTTIELPDELLLEVQHIAREESTTLKSLMEEGLRAVIARHKAGASFVLRDASVRGRGLQPGVRGASWAELRDMSYGGRL
jgi:Bacterial antitoxin of type II TA system, VapB